jgi:methylenetetrahydrofolate reductase (NADPH)
VEGGLAHANELVALIRNEFPQFGVAVAGYPEKHVEAESFESDLDYLRQKVDAGADIVITQLFYDNTDFLRFRDRCESAGISVPIIPGILPITGFAQIERITALCGAKLPADLVTRLKSAADPQVEQRIGLEHAALQVEQLLESGALGLHFYVLNKSEATSAVLTSVGWPNDFRTDGKS